MQSTRSKSTPQGETKITSSIEHTERHVNPDEGHCSCNALYIHQDY